MEKEMKKIQKSLVTVDHLEDKREIKLRKSIKVKEEESNNKGN